MTVPPTCVDVRLRCSVSVASTPFLSRWCWGGLNRASVQEIYGSQYGLASAALEQFCDRARASDVDQDSMDLVVAFLELAPVSDDMRKIASQACDLCFASGPRRVGQRLPAGANRAMP